MWVDKGPETNLARSRKKCGGSKVNDGQVEGDAVKAMGARRMCQTPSAIVGNLVFIRMQWDGNGGSASQMLRIFVTRTFLWNIPLAPRLTVYRDTAGADS